MPIQSLSWVLLRADVQSCRTEFASHHPLTRLADTHAALNFYLPGLQSSQSRSYHDHMLHNDMRHINQPAHTRACFRPPQQLPELPAKGDTCTANCPARLQHPWLHVRSQSTRLHTHCPSHRVFQYDPSRAICISPGIAGALQSPQPHSPPPSEGATQSLVSVSQRQAKVKIKPSQSQHCSQLLPFCSHCCPALYTCARTRKAVCCQCVLLPR